MGMKRAWGEIVRRIWGEEGMGERDGVRRIWG